VVAWSGVGTVGWRGGDRTGAVKDDRAGQRGGPAGSGLCSSRREGGAAFARFLSALALFSCWDLRQWVRGRSGQKPPAAAEAALLRTCLPG
jgi:hypothetical protein